MSPNDRKFIDLTGQRFGRLLVLARGENAAGGRVRWLVVCDCGRSTLVQAGNLRSGATRSCGCQEGRIGPSGVSAMPRLVSEKQADFINTIGDQIALAMEKLTDVVDSLNKASYELVSLRRVNLLSHAKRTATEAAATITTAAGRLAPETFAAPDQSGYYRARRRATRILDQPAPAKPDTSAAEPYALHLNVLTDHAGL
jgi:hypothetical protein